MSVEPPPDWVESDADFHHRRSILDGESRRPTRSIPRVVLEAAPHAAILEQPGRPEADDRQDRMTAGGGPAGPTELGRLDGLRRAWEDLAFTTLRRTQLLTFLAVVVVMTLTFYGWQRGTLPGTAADISAERIVTDAAPAAPRLSSDQVAWADGDDESRRSTASFASDRAFSDQGDKDQPTSGAKLFVADGKKSAKGTTTGPPEYEATDDTSGRKSRTVESGAGSRDTSNTGSSARKQTEITTSAVRYESCAEAAAAGSAPIELGEPGYRLSLDADRDGVACENGSAPEEPGDGPVDSLYSNPTTTASTGDSGSTTLASSTGAGTTSTAESTTTSGSSTTESATTTTVSTESSRVTSTTETSTSSTTEATTSSVSTPTTASSTSSSTTIQSSTTTTTVTSSTTTTPASASTTASSATSTSSTTIDQPQIDPVRFGRPVR